MNIKSILKTGGIVVAFIAVVIFMGYLIYTIFFRGDTGPGPGQENINGEIVNSGDFPISNENVNEPIVDTNVSTNTSLPVLSPIANGGNTIVNQIADGDIGGVKIVGNNLRYYDKLTGKFYQISADGKTRTLLSEDFFPNADSVEWSPSGSRAIISFPDGTNIVYDFSNDSQITLPKEMDEVKFSATGEQLGFEYIDDYGTNFLGISSGDGTGIKQIELLGDEDNDVEINWSPTSQVVATFRKTSEGDGQKIYFIGQSGENFKLLNVPGRGFEGQWNEAGTQMVYSTYSATSDYNPELKIADVGGDNTGRNTINTGLKTWSNKCTIGGGAVYCGVPIGLDSGSGLYPELADSIDDNIYRVDLKTGAKTKLATPKNQDRDGYSVDQIYLSPDERTLFFTDKLTGELYSLKLK
jgi:sugar lactone lactonase YvrE